MVMRHIYLDAISTNIFLLENLDDGKVIHLVVRPMDAPRNSNNGKIHYFRLCNRLKLTSLIR